MTCDTLHMLERILKSVTYLLTYLVTDRTKSRDAVASKKKLSLKGVKHNKNEKFFFRDEY